MRINVSLSEIREMVICCRNVGQRRVSAFLVSVLWVLDPKVLVYVGSSRLKVALANVEKYHACRTKQGLTKD